MFPEQVDELVAALHESAAGFTRREVGDLDAVLGVIVAGAVATVPGVSHAGITVFEAGGRLTSTAPSGEVVARLDQAQAVLREGPCMTVLAEHLDPAERDLMGSPADRGGGEGAGSAVRVDDMGVEAGVGGRWPRFAPEALRNGIVSMLSLPLSGRRRPARVLNLYAESAGAFDTTTHTVAALFADQAAIALYGAEHAAALDQALATRDRIGQAKGILVERHHLADPEQAFTMLVDASQATNIKLRDVADWVVTDTTRTGGAGVAAAAPPVTVDRRRAPGRAPDL